MRRRISWLVITTTSAVVVSFVIPLCLTRLLALPRESYDSAEELVESGWRVD